VDGIDFQQLLVAFSVLIASLTFHEAAHAWTANRLGDPTARMLGRLSLNPAVHVDVIGTIVFPLLAMLSGIPLLGWAKPVPVDMRNLRHPRRDFAVVAAAGPISNVILAAAGSVVFKLLPAESGGLLVNGLELFILLNVMLAVFNMIPVPPLDGGKLRPWGFLLLYALMLSGLLSAIMFPVQRAVLSVLL
jgi:Zn-dependent protease